MKKLLLAILLLIPSVAVGQVSGTPGQLRVTIDANGSLVAIGVAQSSPTTGCLFINCRMTVDASGNLKVVVAGGAFTSPLQGPDGTCAAPTYSFSNQTGLGFWRNGAGVIAVCGNAYSTTVPFFQINTNGNNLALGSSVAFQWSATNDASAGADTIIGRGGVNKFEVFGGTNTVIQLGGTTSSFPSLKRSGTILQSRLADDSADASVQGIYISTGTGLAVANVGANSCGTTAASIAGGNNAFAFTVGATSGTQCRITFTFAAATEWDCAFNDQTTTIAIRSTPVDTTHTDAIGSFTAADKVTGVCFPR